MESKRDSSSFSDKRRKLLKFLGLGTAIFISKPGSTQIRVNPKILGGLEVEPNYLSITLLRQFDLLSLELRYYNFSLNRNNILQRKGNPAYVVVIFQPQSMSEQAWKEEQNNIESPILPGKMLIGGESRLVFSIPESITAIPLDINEMLAWEKYNLVVNERATQPAVKSIITPGISPKIDKIKKKITPVSGIKNKVSIRGITKDEKLILNRQVVQPERNSRAKAIINVAGNVMTLAKDPVGPLAELETSLEVPMRLYLSPTGIAGWNHVSKLNSAKGILKETNRLFELWHTRMGTKLKNGTIDESSLTNEQRILRALWADDAKKGYKAPVMASEDKYLGLTSMSNKDRHRIVHESSNFHIPGFVPQPIKAYKLFLTTLGAWLDSELLVERKKLESANILFGNDNNALNLLKWRHIETMGREHYVEIVEAGNIMPFGHEAVLIKITERKPHAGTGTAANFQRMIVVVTETVKDYNYRDAKGEFMNFCFSKVEMVTTTSPLLDFNKKKLVDSANMVATDQFIIRSNNQDVLFKIKAEDLDGNFIDFSLPLAFISTNVLGNANNRVKLIEAYNAGIRIANKSNLLGQKFTLAPQITNGVDTAYVAKDITFGARNYPDDNEPQGFLPVLNEARIVEPSYQHLTGITQTIPVSLEDDNNKGHVFAKINFSQPVNFAGQSDKTGGLATPNFNLSGLSKLAGAFGGNINKFKNAEASADDFFNVNNLPDPKLFGAFKLSDILNFVAGDMSSYDISKPLLNRAPKIPNLTTEETAEEYITSYVIKPQVNNVDLGFASFVKKGNSSFSIVTQAKIKKKNPTAVPVFGTDAYLTAFKIAILKGLINIDFNKISFTSLSGKKADVSVEMANPCVVFGGALSFVNNINSLIPANGFSDPPYLDVSLTGIKCGYSLAIPNVQMGAFTLSNITLGAEVNLPFTGAPLTFAFNFCSREQPFCLTVAFLGGGGSFGLEVDMLGIRMIEASLEFGAAASLNLGVASGAVSIMAGIYFKMELQDGHNSTSLTGYVRINGAMSVLGLITASIELYMALTYLVDKEKAFGEASLKMKVEVLFFSKSVTIHTQRTFKGSGKDPNFQMAIKENEWLEYCAAYAA